MSNNLLFSPRRQNTGGFHLKLAKYKVESGQINHTERFSEVDNYDVGVIIKPSANL